MFVNYCVARSQVKDEIVRMGDMLRNGCPTYDGEGLQIGTNRRERYTNIHIGGFFSSLPYSRQSLVNSILVTLKKELHSFVVVIFY